MLWIELNKGYLQPNWWVYKSYKMIYIFYMDSMDYI